MIESFEFEVLNAIQTRGKLSTLITEGCCPYFFHFDRLIKRWVKAG